MTESPFPTTSGLHTILGRFRGATAYVIPMTNDTGGALGNNGDELMLLIFDALLKELGIAAVPEAVGADIVVVPPSGSLLEQYAFPDLLAARLRGFEDKPVIVFPSSLFFPTSDPARIFRHRTAETILLLRERRSHEHLTTQWAASLHDAGVALHLDHDVVASGHEYVRDIFGEVRNGGGLLVAARRDRERDVSTMNASPAPSVSQSSLRRVVKAIPYGRLRTRISRSARRSAIEVASNELWRAVPDEMLTRVFGHDAKPRRLVDASATQFATFAEYRRLIARADGVVTNRLHVGLPAAILGKSVVLVEGGYHKISGVHAQSMTSAPNVTLVSPSDAPV